MQEQPDVDEAALPRELRRRERLHFIKTEDLGRGRLHRNVDGRQGCCGRLVIGAAGRRGPVRQGGRRAGGRDGRRLLEYHH